MVSLFDCQAWILLCRYLLSIPLMSTTTYSVIVIPGNGLLLRPLVIQSIIQHLVSRNVLHYVRTTGLKGRAFKDQTNPITEFKSYYSQAFKRALNAECVCDNVYNTKSATKCIRLRNTGHDKRSFSGQQLVSRRFKPIKILCILDICLFQWWLQYMQTNYAIWIYI